MTNIKITTNNIPNPVGSYNEKCYYLDSGTMIGYSLVNQEQYNRIGTSNAIFLTQIGSYIIAFRHSNLDQSINTIECTISTLYYI